MHSSRRLWIKALGVGVASGYWWESLAESFPSRTIRIIVPAAAGGVLDIRGRFVADRMSRNVGYPVIVENKPGAGSIIGADAVAKSAPDGHTILISGGNTFVTNPYVMPHLPFDPIKDFFPITQAATAPFVLVVQPSLGVKSMAALVALAKSKPGQLTYSSAGSGTFTNIVGEVFKQAANIDVVHVPYKGDAPALADVVAGHVDMTFSFPMISNELIKASRVVALMQSGKRRISVLPEVPTAQEAGFPALNLIAFSGFWAPAKTPASIVKRLSEELLSVLRSEEYKKFTEEAGSEAHSSSPEEFAAFLEVERSRWSAIIKKTGVKMEQ